MLHSAYRLFRAFTKTLRDDSVSAFAAQAAFFTILSVFPFLVFLLTLLNYLPLSVTEIQEFVLDLFPSVINTVITGLLTEISTRSTGTVLSVSVLAALWSSSRGALALVRGINAIYGHKDQRNYLRLRAISVLYTFVFAVLLIFTLTLLVFGNQVYRFVVSHIPVFGDAAFLILSMRPLITMLLLTFFFLLLYMIIPTGRVKLFHALPGAILSAGGWLGFSFLFSFYIDRMGRFSRVYGSLTAVAVCMLWLYFCMYILFIGAKVNVILSHPKVADATRRFFQKH
ncbi:MAG: YihY/virulence factor BrkB family protein [Lachnospiraceae bacterium]|nr:YihY/virulence factor BrkB family protein [Lachnospiraceae bacterium]